MLEKVSAMTKPLPSAPQDNIKHNEEEYQY